MASPTPVNDQITDAVTQSDARLLGETPSMAIGPLYQNLAHSAGMLFENAVAAQQVQNTLVQAAAGMSALQLYSAAAMASNFSTSVFASSAAATEKVGQSGIADNMTGLLSVLKAFQS